MSVTLSLFALVAMTVACGDTAKNPPFVDCDPSDTTVNPYRVCCTDESLPKGCECFDIMKDTDFTNTVFKKPKCPCDAGVQFYFYDRDNTDAVGIEIKAGPNHNIDHIPFNSSRRTIAFAHGYSMSYLDLWCLLLKDELLATEDINMILVNWKDGAALGDYDQSAANTRVAGAALGKLLQDLIEVGGQAHEDIYLIGFSMGTHVVGVAGKEVHRLTGKKIGRITGLDPAGQDWEFYSPNVRLDKSDAMFVDTIHTDAAPILNMGLGMFSSIGHVDFFVNGAVAQPGCPGHPSSPIVQYESEAMMLYATVCSHGRANDYYRLSINTCRYTPDTPGSENCVMGYHLDTSSCRGDFNLTTTDTYPYC